MNNRPKHLPSICAQCGKPFKRGEQFLRRPIIHAEDGTTLIDYPKKVHYPVCPRDTTEDQQP